MREATFGRRGRAAMARALGITPSTYNYYERERVPPAHLLARIAEVAGARLEWLITGRGAPFAKPAGPPPGGGARNDAGAAHLVGRLGALLAAQPRLAQPVAAFVRLLEEMADREERAPAGAKPEAVPADLIPVIGTTAAGVARFWREFGPGEREVTTIDQRAREVLGRGLTGNRLPAQVAAGPAAEGAATSEEERSAALIQMSQPDGKGVLEFIDCPFVRSRVRHPFGLRIDGDSMAPRYRDGDILLFSPDEPAREGQPAVVKLAGQIGVTCKLFVVRGDRVHLVPINERFPATEHPLEAVQWALAVLWRVVPGPLRRPGGEARPEEETR